MIVIDDIVIDDWCFNAWYSSVCCRRLLSLLDDRKAVINTNEYYQILRSSSIHNNISSTSSSRRSYDGSKSNSTYNSSTNSRSRNSKSKVTKEIKLVFPPPYLCTGTYVSTLMYSEYRYTYTLVWFLNDDEPMILINIQYSECNFHLKYYPFHLYFNNNHTV